MKLIRDELRKVLNENLNTQSKYVLEKFKNKELEDSIVIVMDELIKGRKIKNVIFLGEGRTSIAIEFVMEENSFVLKLGGKRVHFPLPEHKHILKPLLRKEILDKNGEVLLTIEIQDKVKAADKMQYGDKDFIDGRDLAATWMEMMRDGICAGDMELPNFGRDKTGNIVLLDTDKVYTQAELGDEWYVTCHNAFYGTDYGFEEAASEADKKQFRTKVDDRNMREEGNLVGEDR